VGVHEVQCQEQERRGEALKVQEVRQPEAEAEAQGKEDRKVRLLAALGAVCSCWGCGAEKALLKVNNY